MVVNARIDSKKEAHEIGLTALPFSCTGYAVCSSDVSITDLSIPQCTGVT
jgi:hypothetical protein